MLLKDNQRYQFFCSHQPPFKDTFLKIVDRCVCILKDFSVVTLIAFAVPWMKAGSYKMECTRLLFFFVPRNRCLVSRFLSTPSIFTFFMKANRHFSKCICCLPKYVPSIRLSCYIKQMRIHTLAVSNAIIH